MRFADRTVAIVFESIGSDTSKPNGIAYSYGPAPTSTTDYEWVVDSLIQIPATITDSVDIWTGQVKTSPINVSLANVDIVATKLLYQQARTDVSLSAAISATATSLALSDVGLSGTVVYIGNEAILLGTYSGGTYPCTRGYYSTIAEPHPSGSFAYTKNPFLLYRTYRLIVYDHLSGSEQTIQRGYIANIETNNEGTTVEVACQELLGLISGAQLNRGAPKISITGSVITDDLIGGQLDAPGTPMRSRIWRDDSTAKTVWLNVGGTVVLGSIEDGSFSPLATGAVAGAGAPEIDYDRVDDAAASPFSDTAYEMFVVVRSLFGAANTLASSGGLGASAAFNATQLAYSFLRGGRSDSDAGVDQWSGDWGMGLPEEYFDTASIDAVIARGGDVVQQLQLGWDGEPVEVEDLVCNKLLRPRGKFLANTQAGLITIGEITTLDILQFANAPTLTPIPTTLKLSIDLNGAFSAVSAEVGGTPWSDPDRIIVESRTGQAQDSTRRSLYDTRRELVYDYSTIYAGGSQIGIQATLLSRLMGGIQAVPKVTIEVVEDPAVTYDLGSWYKIAAPEIQQAWWVDADGERVYFPSTPEPQFTGLLVGRRYDIARGRYTLTLLMMQYRDNRFVRWRAPSGVVASYSGSTITLEPNVFHADALDASKFSVGDVVQLFYPDGVATPGGDPSTITGISGNTVTLYPTFVDTPTTSMVLRLTNFNTYADGGEPVAGAGRAYVFYADQSTGYIYGTEPADIYG